MRPPRVLTTKPKWLKSLPTALRSGIQAGVRTAARHRQGSLLAADISRWENAPTLREIIRLTYALVDIWCGSYRKPPPSVVLDIDDTVDVVHGHQQLAQWNAHYDERCFLPIHVYDAATGAPVTVILRPGKRRAVDDEELGASQTALDEIVVIVARTNPLRRSSIWQNEPKFNFS